MDIEQLISVSVKQKASDLHLASGNFPAIRVDGNMQFLNSTLLQDENLRTEIFAYLDEQQIIEFEQLGVLDFLLLYKNQERFRAHLFLQHNGISIALRCIPQQIPTLDSLSAPEKIQELLKLPNGLLLFTGATGSGKSTTLAACIQAINEQQSRHIIILEDPIEFVHHSKKCLIQQKEIGVQTVSFAAGLRAALREDPDIIVIGELRDKESIELALNASSTGHLVLASLHTSSTIQSIERIVDQFPSEEKHFVCRQLATVLQGVMSQELWLRKQGGRIALFELLIATDGVRHIIREEKLHQILSLLQTGREKGMQTMEHSLQQRKKANLI